MTPFERAADLPARSIPPVRILLPQLLILVLALLPPETRGSSAAACAALLVVWAGLVPGAIAAWCGPAMAVLVGIALPLALIAPAPGLVVEPIALAAVTLLLGSLAWGLRDVRGANRALVSALGLAVAAVAAYGLYQVLGGLARVAAAAGELVGDPRSDALLRRALEGRAFALFPTPAALAGFLVLAVPIVVGEALARHGRARLALGLAAVLGLAGLLATRSVTGGGALLGALLLLSIRWRDRGVGRTLRLAIAILVVVLATSIAWRGLEALDPQTPQGPLRLRAANARAALSMIVDHPWAGVGLGGFAEAYPEYRRPGDNETRHAHNLPLELMAELGLPVGLAASLAFFVVFLGPLYWPGVDRSSLERGAAIGLGAFAIQSLGDFTAQLPSLLWTAAIVRGALLGGSPTTDVVRLPRSTRPGEVPWAVVRFALSLAAGTVIALGGRAAEAREDARQAAAADDRRGATSAAARAARLAPWSPEGPILLAEIALSAAGNSGELDREMQARAARAAARAVALAPGRAYARYLRARARIGQGDLPGAFADAREAARLYPMREEYATLRDHLARQLRVPRGGEAPR